MATATASMSLQTSLLQLSGRLPAAVREDNALKQACSTQDVSVVLEAWQQLLLDPRTTLAAGGALRGQLLSLASALVDEVVGAAGSAAGAAAAKGNTQTAADGGKTSSKGIAVLTALLRLLELNPNISRLLPRLLAHVQCPLTYILQQQQQPHEQQQQQELLALSVLRALQLHPSLSTAWRGSLWFQLLRHASPVVRCAAVGCVGLMLCAPDAVTSQLMSAHLSTQQQVEAMGRWEEERAAVALELARRWQPCPPSTPSCSCCSTAAEPSAQQQPQQLVLPPARGFVRVCGLEVPATGSNSNSNSNTHSSSSSSSLSWAGLVQTPAMSTALEAAALALCQGLPVVVEGPPGCGKTSLLRALAAATGNAASALWLHLDDQQDAKSLLGSYSCSAVPGEFVWQPGPLARAVAEGRWVVIEGVDSAPPDILAALLPLLESGVLHVPSRGQVLTAAPGFQVLGTITSTSSSISISGASGVAAAAVGAGSSTAQDVLGSLWAKVRLAAPTEAEQLQVLQGLYPDLAPLLPLAQATVNLLHLAGRHAATSGAAAGSNSSSSAGGVSSVQQQAASAALAAAGVRPGELALSLGRHTSTRDLIKWCARMVTCHGPLLTRCLKQFACSTTSATQQEQQQQQKKKQRRSKGNSSTAASDAGAAATSSSILAAAAAPMIVDLTRVDQALKLAAFAEAADLFAGVVAKPESKLKLLGALAALWGCAGPADVALQYEELSKPNMRLGGDELQVGRAVLPVQQQSASASAPAAGLGCFTPTGLALRLMERIGVCLSRSEPVLLVGETGTGKTTTLTQLARLSGANLVALNMSQQTDSSDLLGGYKPVGVGEALLPLLEPFGELLRRTWKKGNNEEFLSRTLKYAQRKKWSHLLAAYKTALAKLKLDQQQSASTTTAAAAAGGGGGDASSAPTQQQQPQQQEHTKMANGVSGEAEEGQGGVGRSGAGSKGKAAADSTPRKKRRVTPEAADPAAAGAGAAQKAAAGKSSSKGGKKAAKAAAAAGGDAAAAPQATTTTPGSDSSGGGIKLPADLQREWRRFAADVEAAERASAAAEGGFAFAFVEGALVKALKHGWWLLLDEINLAPPEVLERIAGILECSPATHSHMATAAGSGSSSGGGVGGAAAAAGGAVSTAAAAAEDASSGLLLVERGDVSVISRHPGFRLVAAMNPATDAGKRDLPPQLRSRFTEFWVGEPRSREDLCQLVGGYLTGAGGPAPPVDAVVSFYVDAKAAAETRLTDGGGHRPAYSLRTLCRALDYARRAAPAYGLNRSLWDGLSMSFLTQLSPESGPKLAALMQQHLLPGGTQSIKALMRAPPCPGDTHVLFEQFWLERGPLPLPALGRDDDGASRRFVLTASVKGQLANLARCVLARRHPILLQGPTSSGKTSLVGYLAAQTGHRFVRINNHQHTDLQEYLGSWVPDEQGRLVFREGALVTALREGHWLVLDELNLAPTEVLEALNRLLDDNRELFVPELQEVVRPHPHFMLFATQNPPGLYAGRKALSRAFRGRFLELHVEELPDSELSDILHQRCGIAPSYASKMVAVMRELQRRRQRSNVFAGRHGFITPRDLFRWAERGAVGYEALAVDGFCVLGERLRSGEERALVVEVLESVLRVKLDMEQVYTQVGAEPQQRLTEALAKAEAAAAEAETARLAAAAAVSAGSADSAGAHDQCSSVVQLQAVAAAESAAAAAAAARDEAAAIQGALGGMVWTRSLKRLYTLVDRCLRHEEPVLLVGETGTGKTSVCQLLALMRHTHLHVLNCNQHTETSDFLGGFRPSRTRTRDLAHLHAVALGLLQSPAWQVVGQQPSPELSAAATAAASPVEVEALLSALSAEVKGLQGVLTAALQHIQQQQQQQGDDVHANSSSLDLAVAAAVAAAAGDGSAGGAAEERVQQLLQQLAEGAASLKAAAAAARAPFGWEDGPLVVAMRRGQLLLVDELNLAEDAVLERLNSVLEPGRSLTLAEKGGAGAELVVGAPGFLVLATMNPGGDFGKKELSPALSNRFTQIWVPSITDESELQAILESRLANSIMRTTLSSHLLRFWATYVAAAPAAARGGLSVRDLLAWVGFINTTEPQIGPLQAYAHGAYLTLLDGLGLGLGIPAVLLEPLKARCRQLLLQQLSSSSGGSSQSGEQQQQVLSPQEAAAVVAQAAGEQIVVADAAGAAVDSHTMQDVQQQAGGNNNSSGSSASRVDVETADGRWGIPPFFVVRGPQQQQQQQQASSSCSSGGPRFNFQAPTTCRNAFRLLRAMQLGKAVLLEGSPGVGKTSLVSALSRAAGVSLVRINCSEHTDMIDLLGADLPAPGGAAGQFAWCDGPLLSAVKAGHWVLLDELNLAGQSVLEGLNGLLDHRAALFVPELGTSFKAHPNFRLFAAQNPLQEGGGRKGLPRSFLNRFTRVAVELLQPQDLVSIATALHPELPAGLVHKMVALLTAMQQAAAVVTTNSSSSQQRKVPFAVAGGPWEFNLRDLLRWCELVTLFAQQQQQQEGASHGQQQQQGGCEDTMDVDAAQQQHVAAAGCSDVLLDAAAEHYLGVLFTQRLRTAADRQRLQELFAGVWGRALSAASSTTVVPSGNGVGDCSTSTTPAPAAGGGGDADSCAAASALCVSRPSVIITPQEVCVGLARVPRAVGAAASHLPPSVAEAAAAHSGSSSHSSSHHSTNSSTAAGAAGPQQQQQQQLLLPGWQAPLLESVLSSLSAGWMVLLVGGSGSGKTSLARLAAGLLGVQLQELGLTQGTDTSDLLGSFEQVEPARKVQELSSATQACINTLTQHLLLLDTATAAQHQGYANLACQVQELLPSLSQQQQHQPQQSAGPSQQQQQQASGDAHSVADTVQQLQELCRVLQQLQQVVPAGVNSSSSTATAATACGGGQQQQLLQRHVEAVRLLLLQVAHLSQDSNALLQDLLTPSGQSTAGRFEWVDGSLTKAIQTGTWVLLDNANLVNPTVLDRLNGLLEPGGVLQLDEAGGAAGGSGGGRVVVPHPGFRLLLAYDPKHGEVSRAMRNRGVELFLLSPAASAPAAAAGVGGATRQQAGGQAQDQQQQQYQLPPAASMLALSWSQSGQPDLESLLASTGVAGSDVLQAMASAHCSMGRACADAHRRTPGLSEAKTWAGAAGVLLQQGWCLSPALWQAWVQAYMRSYAVTEGLVAAGQAAFLALCQQLQLQAPAAASTHDVVVAVADGDSMLVDDDDEQQQQQLALAASAATGPLSAWPNNLLRPCQWPVWLGLQELSSASAAASVVRHVSLPVWLLAQAVAADVQAAAASAEVSGLFQQLTAAQQVLLPSKLQKSGAASSSSSSEMLLPQLVVQATLSCLLQPPPPGAAAASNGMKQQWMQQQLHTVAEAVARLQQVVTGAGSSSITLGSSSQQLTALVRQLPAVLAAQPWSAHLEALLPQQVQQQLLVSAMQLPQQPLSLLLPLVQQAVCHAAVESAVAAAAPQANAAGAASPYQQSVWRSRNAQERARCEASHPAVDFLQPCLAAVAEAEAAALTRLTEYIHNSSSSTSSGDANQLLQAVERLQMARHEVWHTCHGSLQQQFSVGSSSSASVVSVEVQPERLAWAWAQLHKRMQQLLNTSGAENLLPADSARRWEYLSQQMSAALQLDGSTAKPLLWRLGGHPQLPTTMELLQAQRRVAALASALAVSGGSGFRVDSRGQPAALVAAGLDWQGLVRTAVAAARVERAAQQEQVQQPVGPNGIHMFGQDEDHDDHNQQQQQAEGQGQSAGVDFDLLLDGLDGGSAVGPEAELREQLAQAAAAVLSSSSSFRHSVAQGLALLGFFPHMQLLQQHQQSAGGSAGRQQGSTAALAMQAHALLQVADALQEQASTLLLPVLTSMLLAPQRLQHDAAGAAAVAAALQQRPPSVGSTALGVGQQLPARAMVSPAVRQMQVDLQPLIQLSALQEQQQLNTASLLWLLQAGALSTQTADSSSSSNNASGSALMQQLVGLESGLLRALSTVCQSSCQGSAAEVVPYLQLSWLLSSMLDNQQWPLPPLLLQQVMPGLLHEAWHSWQAGLWVGGDAVSGTGDQLHQQGSSSRVLPVPVQVLSSPVCLHVAAQTVAALQVCSTVAADGTSKLPRLQQLSLAVQHLLRRPASPSRLVAPAAGHTTGQHWAVVAALLSQLLLVHGSSFGDTSDAALLQQLAGQLLAWSSDSAGCGCRPSAGDAEAWLQQLQSLLARSTHAGLTAAAQELIVPCAAAVLEARSGSTTGQWYAQVGAQGWAYLLLGCARLQLVAPPSGVDPAGKYGYKAEAVVRWVSEQLDPQACVQHLQQQLPGGLDTAPALRQLLQDRQAFAARLAQLRSRCVPRPEPPQYHHLQQEVSAFSSGLADPARLLAVGKALLVAAQAGSAGGSGVPSSSTAAAASQAAAHEASSWDGSAAAWSARMQGQFGLYLDILQPVLLAVLEIRHGLCLLAAGSQAAQQAASVGTGVAVAEAGRHSSQQLVSITTGLLAFPPALAPTALIQQLQDSSNSSRDSSGWLSGTPASLLASPQLQQLTGTLVQQQQQLLRQQAAGRSEGAAAAASAASADLAAFTWQLQCAHAALLISVQELLAAGPAAATAVAAAGATERADSGSCLGRVYSLMQQLVSAWQSVKEFEAQAAAEAAQLYKHKTQTKTFLTEEEEAEAEYKAQFPDHYATFADLATAEDLAEDPDTSAADAAMQDSAAAAEEDAMDVDDDEGELGTAAAAAAAATAAQAKSAAAASLLKGQLLQDVVSLHQQLFSTLALHSLQHKLTATAAVTTTSSSSSSASYVGVSGGELQQQQDSAVEEAFRLCFALGRQLVAAQQGLLPASVDDAARPGCIMALALEHRSLNTAASSSAAAVVAAAASTSSSSKRAGFSSMMLPAAPGGGSAADTPTQLDMQQPFPEETALLQAPLAAMSQRLHVLLEEWPDHPLLQQLLAIVDRLLGLPLTTPLKTALTGLELLLARAQVWEETAARHVTLKQQLSAVAGLATRWRKLELASWKGLLERVMQRHAAGANGSWYHLYQLLVLGDVSASAGAGAAGDKGDDSAAAAGGSETGYRRVASLVESFMQTSTLGEFAARLQLLYSFACQLNVTAGGGGDAAAAASADKQRLSNMLWNVLSYYGQYLPDVSAAVESGLAPLRKELSDFVKLAKWEDRGYYAMKISTEKAQRQLHRLSRRAEDVLKQPAAGVLASASQGMGLGQVTAPKAALQAAAAAAKAASKAAKKQAAAAAAAAAAASAAGEGGGVDAAAAAAASTAQKPAAGSAAADIAAAAAAAAEVDPSLLGELEPHEAASSSDTTAVGGAISWASSLDSLAAAAVASVLGPSAVLTAAAGAGVMGVAGGPKQKLQGSRARKAAAAAAAAQFNPSAALADALERVAPLEQQAWGHFSAAVLAAVAAAPSVATTITTSSSHSAAAGGGGVSYLPRLPKLASKMAKVLGPKAAVMQQLMPAAVDAAGEAAVDPAGVATSTATAAVAVPAAVQLDDLAATAASRALSLSTDISKGARLRKKKALNDLLHALAAAGFSKRASDVPADDRDAAAWFSHAQPCVSGSVLLQPLQPQHTSTASDSSSSASSAAAVSGELLLLSASAWSKAERYYYRCLSRLQRLQSAAKAPHKDLVLQEVLAAVGYSQHQMYLLRQQRALLQQLSDAYTQLLQAARWLAGITTTASASSAAAPEYACSTNSSAAGIAPPLPPQAWSKGWLLDTQEQLCSLTYQLSGCRQLLAAVAPMQQGSGLPPAIPSACRTAVQKLEAWGGALQQHRAAVQAQAALLGLAGCPVVSNAAVAVVAAAQEAVAEISADAAATTAAMAAAVRTAGGGGDDSSSSSDADVVCQVLPAWDRVLEVLGAAAQHADRFRQEQQMQSALPQQQRQEAAAVSVSQEWDACLGQLVSQVLVAAQALHGSSSSSSTTTTQPPSAAAATTAPEADDDAEVGVNVVVWGAAAADAVKPSRLSGIAATTRQLLALLAAASGGDRSSTNTPTQAAAAASAMAAQLSAVLPLLQLLLGGLQRSACELLVLHKSLCKLSYITSSIFCSLVAQGYCVPEGTEGAEGGEGGEGEMQWQDAGGTGMGEGTGKKDVSDQLTNEDQLLGAQQKDQQQQQQPEQQQGGEDESAQGVEMEADFEGSLHDIDDRNQQEQGGDDDEGDEEGDDDRIEQQMGEVGDNEERVDERLWGDDDDDEPPQDDQQQQQGPSDAVDRQQQLSVADKSNLEYEGGGEEPEPPGGKQQQQGGDDDTAAPPDKSQQQQQQQHGDSEQEEDEEGPPPPDFDDSYQQQQQHALAPQAPDQELQLPDDLNLDGGDEGDDEGGGGGGQDEQQQQQEEQEGDGGDEQQQQQQKGEDAAAEKQQQEQGDDAAEAAAGEEQQQQGEEGDGPDQPPAEEGGDQDPAAAAAADGAAAAAPEPEGDDAAAPPEGSKHAAPPEEQQNPEDDQDQQNPEQDEDLEAVAAHGAGEEDEQAPPDQLPQAGPQGVASAAAAPEAQATGATDQQQQKEDNGQEQQQADAAQPMDWSQQQQQGQPDAADNAQQAAVGAAGATERGQVAPLQQQGGAQQQQQQQEDARQQQQQQRRSRQPDINPFRNLGDALERWRADLAVQHEAMQQQQQQEDKDEAAAAAAAHDQQQQQDQQQPPAPAADEYQFLNQSEQQTEGTTQALAPATEEQAAAQQQEQATLNPDEQQQQQQGLDDDQQGGGAPEAMDEDQGAAGPDDESAGDEDLAQQGSLAQQTWASGHNKNKPPSKQQQKDDNAAADGDGEQQEEDEEVDVQQQLLADVAAAGAAAAADADSAPSEVAARLAAAQLLDDDGPLPAAAGEGVEGEQAQLLSTQLPPEQAEALRAQLDERLREAATAAGAGAADAGAGDAAAAATYGRDMWGRCEALVTGLAGELTEQLRLILEPSLASRLGGEYRSGKRLNMKRVIGYIASQFRRDKIWMRRSRPDKRRYQVVVAVDDSCSMAENGAACFALEALALLCKAMSRLDVGELGVISYGGGDGVRPLQALEVPFTDAAGPGIMSALRFDQDNTIADRPMLQLVEAVQHLLEGARVRAGAQSSSGSSSDLRQLLLVLGDGRFHEKDALVGAVRQLVEVQGVCPVFIALDAAATTTKGASAGAGGAAAAAGAGGAASAAASAGSSGGSSSKRPSGASAAASSSLLDMQSVKFVDGKPVFERYMDTFPFPYYIVLRDIAALPATLADLLRQWFELNASSS